MVDFHQFSIYHGEAFMYVKQEQKFLMKCTLHVQTDSIQPKEQSCILNFHTICRHWIHKMKFKTKKKIVNKMRRS